MKDKQLNTAPFQGWPSGNYRDLLELRITSNEISERTGLVFVRQRDDLDWGYFSHYFDDVIGPVVVIEYENMPGKTTSILVDRQIEVAAAIAQVRKTLDLSETEIAWYAV